MYCYGAFSVCLFFEDREFDNYKFSYYETPLEARSFMCHRCQTRPCSLRRDENSFETVVCTLSVTDSATRLSQIKLN